MVLHAILTFAGNAIAGLHIVSDDSPSTTQALVLQLALAALQMLVFLPLTVTWFRIVVIGEHEALQRSMFTFGRTERRFFGLQLLCLGAASVAIGLCAAISYILIVLAGDTSVTQNTALALRVASAAWTGIWIVAILLILVRLSMAFVLAALDQPGGLKPAWRMTEGLGWRLLGATLLCAIATVPVMLFFKLLGSLLDGVLDLRRAPTAMGPAEVITSTIGGSMATLIALLAISTLVGVVYRLLMPPAPAV